MKKTFIKQSQMPASFDEEALGAALMTIACYAANESIAIAEWQIGFAGVIFDIKISAMLIELSGNETVQ